MYTKKINAEDRKVNTAKVKKWGKIRMPGNEMIRNEKAPKKTHPSNVEGTLCILYGELGNYKEYEAGRRNFAAAFLHRRGVYIG